MKWLRQLSIYYKINGIIISMLLLLSIIIGFIMMDTTTKLLDQQIEKRGAEMAAYVAALSSNDILLDDNYALFDRINQTKNNTEDVRYILITDSAGRILAHTFAGNLPKGLPIKLSLYPKDEDGYQTMKFNSNEGPIREVIVPIENGAIGYVRVGMSEKSTQQLLSLKLYEFFITTLLICLLAAMGSTYLAYLIIHPMRNLTKAAQQIQQGNFYVQTEIKTEDEVGRLAGVFNEMIESLKEKDFENNRLLKELRAKEELRTVLLNKLFTVQEDERKRISRELHDETSQSMASLLAYMKVLLSKLTDEKQRSLLLDARNVATNVLGGLRKMAVELRPPVLDDLGIVAAMDKYITNFSNQQDLIVTFSPPDQKLIINNQIALTLYRILQESLTNISKHACATSVNISLKQDASSITLRIDDNGLGIRSGAIEAARQKNRLGIYGMKERVELLGGNFTFHSISGQGTTITVIIPIRCLE
ncbi:ATP-binding protein [Pelosinus propionicus]|uniref:Oxygen sensor histidine kinase NreB n=1 Tax=Pelosinus propionicus DSM 13327 TaxID=1123291 RepID=A0A1I4KZ88_9FIRM|nr:ATP-binding protein [Pelosinus propionicus]SFL83903.1 Signal transduction histidine kinase [Pelosinus propionicus DSM 13327]